MASELFIEKRVVNKLLSEVRVRGSLVGTARQSSSRSAGI